MVTNYGVLRGPVVDFGREDSGSSPHFQVVLLAGGNRWRLAVNVESGDHSQVIFSIVDPLINHRMIAEFPSIPEGFTKTSAHPTWFLDFLREPIFDMTTMRALPPTATGPDNDLQDFISHKIELAKQTGRPVFAFGAMFDGSAPVAADHQFHTNGGIHDIHMNQGNQPGNHNGDNGIHQDGGLIIQTGDNSFAGVFMAFQTQLVPTDDHGNVLPTSKPILTADPSGNVAVQAADLSIVGACVNPPGVDVGLETVILVNTTPASINLAGFALEDKQGLREPLTGALAAGDVRKIVLSGNHTQLGNNGGVIRVVRVSDGGIIHAVTYTAQGTDVQGRTLVF